MSLATLLLLAAHPAPAPAAAAAWLTHDCRPAVTANLAVQPMFGSRLSQVGLRMIVRTTHRVVVILLAHSFCPRPWNACALSISEKQQYTSHCQYRDKHCVSKEVLKGKYNCVIMF